MIFDIDANSTDNNLIWWKVVNELKREIENLYKEVEI